MKPEQIAYIMEAERRGKLSADQSAWLTDARKRGVVPEAAESSEMSAWKSALLGAAESMLGTGLGDEAAAGLAAFPPGGGLVAAAGGQPVGSGDYAGELEKVRGQFADAREAHPAAYMAGEFASALPTGGAGTARAATGVALRQAIPRAATVSGTAGGIAGLGYSDREGIADTAADVGLAAGAGASLGAFLPSIAPLLGKVSRLPGLTPFPWTVNGLRYQQSL